MFLIPTSEIFKEFKELLGGKWTDAPFEWEIFNTFFLIIDKFSRKKITKDTKDLNNAIN